MEHRQLWCKCITSNNPDFAPQLHDDVQDTTAEGWLKLLQLIDEAELDGSTGLNL